MGLPARRRRRRARGGDDPRRARRRGAGAVAARRARARGRDAAAGQRVQGRDRDGAREARAGTARWRRRLLALGLVALAAAGCGGSKKADTTTATTVDANGCTPVAQPPPTQRSEAKPTTKLDPSRHYDVTFHTNCGSFTVRLAVKTSPNDDGLVRQPRAEAVLRPHPVPPDRPRLRDPGRRPDRTRAAAVPATRRSTSPRPGRSTSTARSRWRRRRPSRRAPAAASSSSSRPPTRDYRRSYAVLGHVVKGLAVVDRIGRLGNAQRAADRAGRDRARDARELVGHSDRRGRARRRRLDAVRPSRSSASCCRPCSTPSRTRRSTRSSS